MLNFLASITTPKKEAASQPTTTLQIQLTPDMSDDEILRQVRSMAITTAEDEPPSTPNDGGGGRSDTRAYYRSPDHVLNAIESYTKKKKKKVDFLADFCEKIHLIRNQNSTFSQKLEFSGCKSRSPDKIEM